MGKKKEYFLKGIVAAAICSCMYFAGRGVAQIKNQAVNTSSFGSVENISKEDILMKHDILQEECENWGLGFGEKGTQPSGMLSSDELKKYDAYYIGKPEEKVLYLTFDAGYENGNTPMILEALKKHQVSATFFVVGHYLETAPDLVKQMIEEGHTVGNHTYHHPNMAEISDAESFKKEIQAVEEKYKEITGEEMVSYYRPPQGKFSVENLKMAQELGYKTFFWSLAYVDWYQDKQPTHEEAFEKLLSRVHPGAVVLLHSTSKTNAEILDELLTKWEEMGYQILPLSDLTK